MNFKRIFLLIALMTYTLGCAMADKGYRITVEVEGLSEGDVMLAYHFGDRQYLQDTARMERPGYYVFEKEERLEPGMYLVVVPGQKYFEIIVDDDQHFGITTKMDEFAEKTQFEGSPENEVFYEYLRFIRVMGEEISMIREELTREDMDEGDREAITVRMDNINEQVTQKQESYIERFPEGLFSKILLAQREAEIPETPLSEDGTPDQKALYEQYKSRYWENIDFSDDRLLRTPVFHNKLRVYFSNVVVQIPDSIIAEADRMVEKTRINDEVFKYTIWFITNHFERSQIMGHDAVFVHMIEKYYMSGEAHWVEAENLARISERAMKLKPLLIGKVAPDINMFRPDQSRYSLHEMNARYTVLYFWDSDCSHCKRVTPQLRTVTEELRSSGVEVFAVNLEQEKESWLKSIDSYQINGWVNVFDPYNQSGFREKYDIFATPMIFLLDSDKKIIAKRISPEQVEEIIHHNEGNEPSVN
ncbi:MAG: thioredoxin-like domain-containing protein [Bacteroidales bacterium]|jgi:peroxiredoxin|nr:thioredoxin-like domain-containing protein [Bacteroidales bacterium]NLM93760.1 redoxin domain-containing protein [Bacteroidales bacterium]